MMHYGDRFLEALQSKAKLMYPSAKETVTNSPEDTYWLLDPLAKWTEKAFGEQAFELAASGYARYAFEVNQLQKKYEQTGIFFNGSHEKVKDEVYDNETYMIPYMWAAILIYPFWPSMVRHISFLRNNFIAKLPEGSNILELACGHGALGLLALNERSDLHLDGYDLSPAAINIAKTLRDAAGYEQRSNLAILDVLDLEKAGTAGRYKGILAAMLAEHLTDPQQLFYTISHHLSSDGICFFSTALESAQKDHIYEFNSESEVLIMADKAGLRVVELISDGPRRVNSKYRPRAMAAILEHKN